MNIINRVDPTGPQLRLGDTTGTEATDPTLVEPAGESAYYSFDGNNDYMQLDDVHTPGFTATAGSYSALITVQLLSSVTYGANFERLISFESAGNNGAWIRHGTTKINIGAGHGGAGNFWNVHLDPVYDTKVTYAMVISKGSITGWDSCNQVTYVEDGLSSASVDPTFLPGRLGMKADTLGVKTEFHLYSLALFKDQALSVDELAVAAARMEAI